MGIAVIGQVGNDVSGYLAWAPLPDRDREKENAIWIAKNCAP
jgi:hypothetical protein